MAVIDSLLVELGFEYDPSDMAQFKKDLSSTTNLVKKFAKVIIAATAAVTGLVTVSTAATDKQGKFADKIGESVGMVDALQFAMERSGGSADGMNSSLESLSRRAGEAARGIGEGVQAFGMLGVNVRDANGSIKGASNLMLEVSSALQGLSKAEQIDFSEKLGIGASLPLLQQGPQAIRDLVSEARKLGVTTAEDAKVAAEFQDTLTDVLRVINQIVRAISRYLGPSLTKINQRFLDWWKLNKDIIELKIPEWIDKAAKAMKLLVIATGLFIGLRILTTLGRMLMLFRSLSVASLIFQGTFLILPALIGLLIVAIAAFAQDAKVFFEGGNSVFGDWIKKFPELESELRTVAAVFATIWDMTKMVLDGWIKIFQLFSRSSIEDIKENLSLIPGFLGDVTGLLTPEGTGVLQQASAAVKNAANVAVEKIDIVIQGGADTAENIATSVYNVFQQTTEELNTAVDQ
jgi:uncharacterized protein YoxC